MLSELLNIQAWDPRENSRLEREIWGVLDVVHTESHGAGKEVEVKKRRRLMEILGHWRSEKFSREQGLST